MNDIDLIEICGWKKKKQPKKRTHKTKQYKRMWKNCGIVEVINIKKSFIHTENWKKISDSKL